MAIASHVGTVLYNMHFNPPSSYLDLKDQTALLSTLIQTTGLDTNGCPLGNSKFILLSDNLNICPWLSACQVEKIDQINNAWSTINKRLSQFDLQFLFFHYTLKRINSDLRATLDPSMADFVHIDSPEGILLVVDEDVLPTLTM